MARWRDRPIGATELALPTDRPPAAERSTSGGFETVTLPADVVADLVALARRERCSLFMVLLSAYQLLLSRHTGQHDICVGTPMASRTELAWETIVGYFTQLQVLRGDLSGDPEFSRLLRKTRSDVLGTFGRPDVPLAAQFQTIMVVLNSPEETGFALSSFGDLELEWFGTGFGQSMLDLTLQLFPLADGGLSAAFGYRDDVFDAATVAGIAARFLVLLRDIVRRPDARIGELECLAAGELDKLSAWGTGPGQPVPAVVPLLIKASDAVAVGSLTYAELLSRAEKLAGALREAGVGPGSVVGVHLPRSPHGVIALLATWLAGAAYLALDPALPAARKDLMIVGSGVEVVISDEPLPGVVRVSPSATAPAMTAVQVLPEWLAYVIYTSGSTGTPKAVAVSHGALAARVAWMTGVYALTPDDCVAQVASWGFDTHAEEIYPALVAGARVEVVTESAALPDFLRSAQGRAVTVLDLPTAYWHELVASPEAVRWPDGLRLVILGGEQASAEAVARWGSRTRLVNTYGPTEATIIATACDLVPNAAARPPIGCPIADTVVKVLDPAGNLTPPGVSGELHIGGAGVAQGYLGQPDFPVTEGIRWYATGDRCRWRPDGQLEFLGRLDDQVKVRGHRIEPAEVRAALEAEPGVDQAVVVAHQDRLVGYLVGTATDQAMRAGLARTLPSYLVPDLFVRLEKLPLTNNGKVDIRALPDPAAVVAVQWSEPESDAEQLVAEIWTEVLSVERVGAADDFFALGGHSLLATRVISRLRATLEIDVPVRAVFDYSTLTAFAAHVEVLLTAAVDELSDAEVANLLSYQASSE